MTKLTRKQMEAPYQAVVDLMMAAGLPDQCKCGAGTLSHSYNVFGVSISADRSRGVEMAQVRVKFVCDGEVIFNRNNPNTWFWHCPKIRATAPRFEQRSVRPEFQL